MCCISYITGLNVRGQYMLSLTQKQQYSAYTALWHKSAVQLILAPLIKSTSTQGCIIWNCTTHYWLHAYQNQLIDIVTQHSYQCRILIMSCSFSKDYVVNLLPPYWYRFIQCHCATKVTDIKGLFRCSSRSLPTLEKSLLPL